jgi:hypothetical protein
MSPLFEFHTPDGHLWGYFTDDFGSILDALEDADVNIDWRDKEGICEIMSIGGGFICEIETKRPTRGYPTGPLFLYREQNESELAWAHHHANCGVPATADEHEYFVSSEGYEEYLKPPLSGLQSKGTIC